MSTPISAIKPARQPRNRRERRSVFLDAGSLKTAETIAHVQTAASPECDAVSVSAVLRQAVALGLTQLKLQHACQAERG